MRPVTKVAPPNYRADINTRTIDFTKSQDLSKLKALSELTGGVLRPSIATVLDLLDDLASGKTKETVSSASAKLALLQKNLNKEEKNYKKLKQPKARTKKQEEIKNIKSKIKNQEKNSKPDFDRLKHLGKVKDIISGKLTEIYREAFNDLTSMLGRYCSYCELLENSSALAVEHVVPKAPYPTKCVDWNNFLLSCPNCNSVKLSKPKREDAKRWAGGAAPTADQLVQAVLDHYCWPHISPYSFRFYLYTLQYKQGNSFVSLSMNIATQHRNFRNINALNKTVTAEVNLGGTWKKTEFVVLPIALDPSPGFKFDKTKNENTIDLVKFRRIINDNQERDIRTSNRTEAWFAVLRHLSLLDENITSAGTNIQMKKSIFNMFWDGLLAIAVLVGFYSIWVTILKEIPYPNYLDNPRGHTNLGQKFVYDTGNTQTNQHRKFPGTNVTSIP